MPIPDFWLLDACCALNLAASGQIEAILNTPISGQSCSFGLPLQVIAESGFLRRGGEGEDAEIRDAYDWQPHFASGLLSQISMRLEEEAAFVSLLQWIDDGEAACLAIAAERGWGVVTDDIAARKRAADVPLLSTPELMFNWAQASIEPEALRTALHKIRMHARYGPPRQHALRQWWLDSSQP